AFPAASAVTLIEKCSISSLNLSSPIRENSLPAACRSPGGLLVGTECLAGSSPFRTEGAWAQPSCFQIGNGVVRSNSNARYRTPTRWLGVLVSRPKPFERWSVGGKRPLLDLGRVSLNAPGDYYKGVRLFLQCSSRVGPLYSAAFPCF